MRGRHSFGHGFDLQRVIILSVVELEDDGGEGKSVKKRGHP